MGLCFLASADLTGLPFLPRPKKLIKSLKSELSFRSSQNIPVPVRPVISVPYAGLESVVK
jgi:hypothetical protein